MQLRLRKIIPLIGAITPVIQYLRLHLILGVQEVFLVCGDRPWAGIPSRLQGGTYTLGQLATLTPNITLIQDWENKNLLAGQKQKYTEFDENCGSKVYDWSKSKRAAVSVRLPWLTATKALSGVSHKQC